MSYELGITSYELGIMNFFQAKVYMADCNGIARSAMQFFV